MKRVFMPFLAMAFSLSLVAFLAMPALAAPGDHTTRMTKGKGADAAWNLYDEASGIQTDIQIYITDDQDHNPPDKAEAAPYLSIYVYQYYVDPYVPIRDIWYDGEIPLESMAVNRNLSSASVTFSGLGEQYDYGSDMLSDISIGISLNWSAVGPVSIDTWTSHNRYADGFTFYHSHGKSREANAQGTLVVGDTSIALDSPYWCSIHSGQFKIISVSH